MSSEKILSSLLLKKDRDLEQIALTLRKLSAEQKIQILKDEKEPIRLWLFTTLKENCVVDGFLSNFTIENRLDLLQNVKLIENHSLLLTLIVNGAYTFIHQVCEHLSPDQKYLLLKDDSNQFSSLLEVIFIQLSKLHEPMLASQKTRSSCFNAIVALLKNLSSSQKTQLLSYEFRSPLLYAAENNMIDAFLCLIEDITQDDLYDLLRLISSSGNSVSTSSNSVLLCLIHHHQYLTATLLVKKFTPIQRFQLLYSSIKARADGLSILILSTIRYNEKKAQIFLEHESVDSLYTTHPLIEQAEIFFLHLLSDMPAQDKLTLLLSHPQDSTYSSALHLATYKGQKNLLDIFLKNISDEDLLELQSKREGGASLLFNAVRGRDYHTVNYLLKKLYPIASARNEMTTILEEIDDEGMTMLHQAAAWGQTLVRPLLQVGASPLARDPIGNTPMHLAAQHNNKASIHLLAPDTIHIKNRNGDTPLHIACTHHSLDAIHALYSLGADPYVKNNKNEMPLVSEVFIDYLSQRRAWDKTFNTFFTEKGKINRVVERDTLNKKAALFFLAASDSQNVIALDFCLRVRITKLQPFLEPHVIRGDTTQTLIKQLDYYQSLGQKIQHLVLFMHGLPFFMQTSYNRTKESSISTKSPGLCPNCFRSVDKIGTIFLNSCYTGRWMNNKMNILELIAILAAPRKVTGSSESFALKDVQIIKSQPWKALINKNKRTVSLTLQAIPALEQEPNHYWVRAVAPLSENAKPWSEGKGVLRSLENVEIPEHKHPE